MRKILTISCMLALLMVLSAGAAKADTLTYNGVVFNVSVSGNTVTMTVNGTGCTFVANCANNVYLGDVTIKAFSSYSGISSSSAPPNYKSAALGNLGGTGCGLQSNGFICFAANSGTSLASGLLTFTATVTDPQLLDFLNGATFSVQAEFYNSSTLIRTGSDNTFIAQMSESVPRDVPEPASLSFLAVGLGGFAFRKFRRK